MTEYQDKQKIILDVLDLCASLIHGRNAYNFQNVSYFLGKVNLIDAFLSKDISSNLRTKFLKLYTSLFVDISPHQQIPIQNVFYLNHLDYFEHYKSNADVSKEITRDIPRLFESLTKYMNAFSKDLNVYKLGEYDIEVIKLCHYLLRYEILFKRMQNNFEIWLKPILWYWFSILRMLEKYQNNFMQHDLRDTVKKNDTYSNSSSTKSNVQESFSRETSAQKSLFDVKANFIDSLNDIQPAESEQKSDVDLPAVEHLSKELIEELVKHILSILHFY